MKSSFRNFAQCFDASLYLKEYDAAKTLLDDFSVKNSEIPLCYEWGAYYNRVKDRKAKEALIECYEEREEPKVYYELARYYHRTSDVDTTLYFVNQYLELKPDDIEGMVLKARALEKINYYTEARKLYTTAIEIDSTSTLAINGLENLERKVAYLRLVRRKERVQRQVDVLKPLNSKQIKQ